MNSMLITTSEQDAFKRGMGKSLHYLRITHKMSLEEMGVQIGVSAQQIHKYEIGQSVVSPIYLQRYADIFKMPIGYFFGENTSMDFDIDRKALAITAEIATLPDDVRMGLYHLAKLINKSCGVGRKAA